MEITVYREDALSRTPGALPAATYNLMHSLLARGRGPLFVPLRAMQVLAIVDAEEVVFLDHNVKNRVELAWERFHPQARAALDAPTPFELAVYSAAGLELAPRLPREFHQALVALAGKDRRGGPATVLRFAARERDAG